MATVKELLEHAKENLSPEEYIATLERTVIDAEQQYDSAMEKLAKAEQRVDSAGVRRALQLPTGTLVVAPEIARTHTVVALRLDDAARVRFSREWSGAVTMSNDERLSFSGGQSAIPTIGPDGQVNPSWSLTKAADDPIASLLLQAGEKMQGSEGWGSVGGKQITRKELS